MREVFRCLFVVHEVVLLGAFAITTAHPLPEIEPILAYNRKEGATNLDVHNIFSSDWNWFVDQLKSSKFTEVVSDCHRAIITKLESTMEPRNRNVSDPYVDHLCTTHLHNWVAVKVDHVHGF